jgi:flagellar biosynthesis/type III secretory pathway chaperone
MLVDDFYTLGSALMRSQYGLPTVYVMKDSEYQKLINKKIDSRIKGLEEHKKSLMSGIENADRQITKLKEELQEMSKEIVNETTKEKS